MNIFDLKILLRQLWLENKQINKKSSQKSYQTSQIDCVKLAVKVNNMYPIL